VKNEIVLFSDGDINLEVELFDVKQATLSEHINSILSSGELDETSIGFSDKSSGGRKPKLYIEKKAKSLAMEH
jgi:hypothetical protein